MIAELRPYPAYKDSGVSWLGQLPEHWEALPNRALFAEVQDRGFASEDMLSVTIARGVIRQTDLLRDSAKKDSSNEDKSAYKLVQPGDIAYNKMRAWQGAIGISRHRGIVSPAYIIMRPREGVNANYLHYLLRTPPFAKEAERWSYGITSDQWSLRAEHFKMIYCSLPSAAEQAAIVRFLDYADLRIRCYIRAKQKLIKLLEEQKEATIHSAITRGLNLDAPTKPSGMDWLGAVPEHWHLKRFKAVTRINSGQVDPRDERYRNAVLIAPNHVERGTGRIILQETAADQGADSGKYLVHADQVIYSKIRPNLRKAAIAPIDCLCSADMYPITAPEGELRAGFLLQLMLSAPFTRYVVDCSLRVAMPKVNRDALGGCWLWYPGVAEQDAILQFLASALRPIQGAIANAQQEIALLTEYRTRLVADVVTGKLDVREAAARLPSAEVTDEAPDADLMADEVTEPEAEDLDAALAGAEF